MSNDRDGTISEANSDVDFFFMRRNISPEDAMEVLELVLKGLINESVDESNNTIYKIGWINDYVSTKLNGTKATGMNLSYSVLGYIPWFHTYQSSKMGPEPQPDGVFNLILWLLSMTNPILNNAIALLVSMTGIEIFAYLTEYCENVFMNVLTAIGDLVWTLIRAAIIIVYLIFFAFMVLIANLLILSILGIVCIIDIFINIEFTFSIDYIKAEGDYNIEAGYILSFQYINFLEVNIPIIEIFFNSDSFSFEYSSNIFGENLTVSGSSNNLFDDIDEINPEFGLSSSQTSSSNNTPDSAIISKYIINLLVWTGGGMGLAGGFVGTFASIITFIKDPGYEKLFSVISLLTYFASLVVMYMTIEHTQSSFYGLSIGLLIAGIYFIKTAFYICLNDFAYMAIFFAKYASLLGASGARYLYNAANFLFDALKLIDLLIGINSLKWDLAELFGREEYQLNPSELTLIITSVVGGCLSLLLAKLAILLFGGHWEGAWGQIKSSKKGFTCDTKTWTAMIFGITSIIFSLIFFNIGKNLPII